MGEGRRTRVGQESRSTCNKREFACTYMHVSALAQVNVRRRHGGGGGDHGRGAPARDGRDGGPGARGAGSTNLAQTEGGEPRARWQNGAGAVRVRITGWSEGSGMREEGSPTGPLLVAVGGGVWLGSMGEGYGPVPCVRGRASRSGRAPRNGRARSMRRRRPRDARAAHVPAQAQREGKGPPRRLPFRPESRVYIL